MIPLGMPQECRSKGALAPSCSSSGPGPHDPMPFCAINEFLLYGIVRQRARLSFKTK